MDRRVTPANAHVAAEELRGIAEAPRFVAGATRRVSVPVADLLCAPGGARDRQLLAGWAVRVLDSREGFSFVQSLRDGYCGYVADGALGPDFTPDHWVTAPATHLFSAADFKSPEVAMLSLGAELKVVGSAGEFAKTAAGNFVPKQCISPTEFRFDDPAGVAESLLGTPYLWGGNSRSGLDCSALVQAAFAACGRPCPGDSDLQEQGLAPGIPMSNVPRRNDLMFWRGHVAIVRDSETLLHANAGAMAVAREGIEAAIARIEAAGDGPVTTRLRLA